MTTSEQIEEIRASTGLSQKKFAEKQGFRCEPSYLGKLETGSLHPMQSSFFGWLCRPCRMYETNDYNNWKCSDELGGPVGILH